MHNGVLHQIQNVKQHGRGLAGQYHHEDVSEFPAPHKPGSMLNRITQGPLLSNARVLPNVSLGDQRSLAFGVSAQTFNVGVRLPGLNTSEFDDLVTFDASATSQFFGAGFTYGFKSFKLESGAFNKNDYFISKYSNRVSAFTDRSGDTNSIMIERIKKAISANPVKFHHVITNDNVNDIELTLEAMQLSFRYIKEPDRKPAGNTALFWGKFHM